MSKHLSILKILHWGSLLNLHCAPAKCTFSTTARKKICSLELKGVYSVVDCVKCVPLPIKKTHMSNIQKQTPIVTKPSPMVPLVKSHHSSKKHNYSYHWYKWKAPLSIGTPFVNCISFLLECISNLSICAIGSDQLFHWKSN